MCEARHAARSDHRGGDRVRALGSPSRARELIPRRRALALCAAAGLALWLPACRRERSSDAGDSSAAAGGLRVDVRHTVRDGEDAFAVIEYKREAAPPSLGANPPDFGDYRATISDNATNARLATIGFDSNIAPEATAAATTLTLRCPMPAAPFRLSLEKRRPGGVFQSVLSDNADASLVVAAAPAAARIESIVRNGAPRDKIDLAIVGDGYTAAEHAKFLADAKRAAGYLFSVEPYRSRSGDFNVDALFVASAESGVSDAHLDRHRKSAFGCAYGSGDGERTLSIREERKLRDAASAVAYDFLLVIANSRRYGGSAYYGGPAVVAIDSASARYLVLHEIAHAIAGLAEEYYIPTADGPAYRGNVEPWHPNVTTTLRTTKWRVDEAAPTRWNKKQYERWFSNYVKRYSALRSSGANESAVEKLMRDAAGRQAVLLGRERTVGLYEGADGYAEGVYRSETDCIMFSLQTGYYCAACTAALARALDSHLPK